LPTTVGKQVGIYLLSLFLPPLGIWPGVKYLLQKDERSKMIGGIAILLTILSTVVTIYFSLGIMKQFTQQLNGQLQINQLP
jgi:hypothetical protein